MMRFSKKPLWFKRSLLSTEAVPLCVPDIEGCRSLQCSRRHVLSSPSSSQWRAATASSCTSRATRPMRTCVPPTRRSRAACTQTAAETGRIRSASTPPTKRGSRRSLRPRAMEAAMHRGPMVQTFGGNEVMAVVLPTEQRKTRQERRFRIRYCGVLLKHGAASRGMTPHAKQHAPLRLSPRAMFAAAHGSHAN